ncbi:MAG: proline--tRNA ligase [Firmicutes bacterium]|nr:proline--tRNA ligase [Dethiobacter sp.]MBS3889224.1 proline--tRNA ligase [Bacillota bacterium]
MSENKLTSQAADFSAWYIEAIQKAELMDYAPVRGCIIFKPDGYELWERIQAGLDQRFKATGHRNAYFPMLIPESFLQKEKEHVEGFNPELPWVTEAGGEKLEEKLALRPTSETMIGHMYSRWIQSYRDLPVLLNQWANVFRWEKRTLPFLRTSEFLWQEGHTAHADEVEAREETMRMLETYAEFAASEMAIPMWTGQKTPSERFAGAVDTYSIEGMMKDGKALQAGTSHFLGQNFAKAFGIEFLDRDNLRKHVYTTSWGVSTRLIGALVMVHGDDKGLALPPKLAPTQVIMIPIGPPKLRAKVMEKFSTVFSVLQAAKIRVRTDEREETPGWKFNEWEMRGVPLRLELGPRDVDSNQCVLVRRDTGEKLSVSLDDLPATVEALLAAIQTHMYEKACDFRSQHSHLHIDNLEQLKAHIAEAEAKGSLAGWVLGGWCGNDLCEARVREETKFTSRNIPFMPPVHKEKCLVCDEKATHSVWMARAY